MAAGPREADQRALAGIAAQEQHQGQCQNRQEKQDSVQHCGELYSQAQVPTADNSHKPKLVKATITASIQYCERIASCAFEYMDKALS